MKKSPIKPRNRRMEILEWVIIILIAASIALEFRH